MKILVCTGPNEAFVIEEIGNGKIEVDFNNRVENLGPEDWYVIDKSHLSYSELDRGNNYDLIISLNVPVVMVDGHIVDIWNGPLDKISSKSLSTYLQELEETRHFLELGDNSIGIAFKDGKYFWCVVEEPCDGFESWFNIPEHVYSALLNEVRLRDFDGDVISFKLPTCNNQ